MSTVREVTPVELRVELESGQATILLDVRNPQEVEICILPNALTIPLPYLQERIDELEELEGAPIVAYCHHGVRSISAAAILMNKGFSDVRSLRGGIDAWAREVAPNMTRY